MAGYIANLPSLGADAGDEATVSFVYVAAEEAECGGRSSSSAATGR